ncbi:MAG: hypothetical protein HC853_14290 [Anaerolineae bacterium]|nr:hypothetical protein [Anaerolineae bacterium]
MKTPKSRRYPIRLRSRRGAGEAAGFLIALPVWWATIGILFVLSFWFWSMAANMMGLTRSGQALAVGKDGEAARKGFVGVALGGYAKDYGTATYVTNERSVTGSVDVTTDVHAFPSPDSITVKARVVTRIEKFYARPPNTGWE